jgi:hypothetical protein
MGKKGKAAEEKLAKLLTDYRLHTLVGLFNHSNWSWRIERTQQDWEFNCSKHIYSVKFFNFVIYNERFTFFKQSNGRLSEANTRFSSSVYYVGYPNGYVDGTDKNKISREFGEVLARAITYLDDERYQTLFNSLNPNPSPKNIS